MSFFAVEKRKISKIISIPEADKVELAQVEGLTFQFVVGKGQFEVGSDVIYFPIDSVLPQPLIDHFGIAKFLSGKDHNRIKSAKFLKQISQGYVASVESVHKYLMDQDFQASIGLGMSFPETDYTEILKVEKWEAPAVLSKNARLIPIKDCKIYDIEGANRYQNVVDYLMDKDVVIEEKIEGSNMHILLKSDGNFSVAQHNFYIESNDPEQPHSFEVVAKRDLLPLAQKLQLEKFPNSDIRIWAEFIGESVQKNIYSIKGHKALIFEIYINNKPMNAIDLIELVKEYNIDFVPILFVGKLRDFLNSQTVQEASNGQSKLANIKREGIVIHPYIEQYSPELDSRLLLKQRSPIYLASTDF